MTKAELLEYLTKEAKKLRQNADFISINKHLTGIGESDMPTAAQIDGVLVAFINYVGMSQCIDYALSVDDLNKDTKFHVGDRIRKINRKEFDRYMSVERVYKDYYLCNNIGKFSSTTIPFAEEDDYELIKED